MQRAANKKVIRKYREQPIKKQLENIKSSQIKN